MIMVAGIGSRFGGEIHDAGGTDEALGNRSSSALLQRSSERAFVVINADDYYGKEAFVHMHDFLVNYQESSDYFRMGMAGYSLKDTLSENGRD